MTDLGLSIFLNAHFVLSELVVENNTLFRFMMDRSRHETIILHSEICKIA